MQQAGEYRVPAILHKPGQQIVSISAELSDCVGSM
jgi:hypothetical protein